MRRGDPDRDPGVRWPQTARDNLCYLFILFLWSALHSFVAALAGGRGTGGASSWRPPSNTLRLIKTRRVHPPNSPLHPRCLRSHLITPTYTLHPLPPLFVSPLSVGRPSQRFCCRCCTFLLLLLFPGGSRWRNIAYLPPAVLSECVLASVRT